ncbi:MAG: C4-dicarboxylate ABC transporter [Alphaproteobacteria bacterium]|jgi:TRAP-type C4-dicarboxylate transport system substrate-binding protein|nr:C4-dicarboxylate ABC transporter [Alphaproteobacteria bacterium]
MDKSRTARTAGTVVAAAFGVALIAGPAAAEEWRFALEEIEGSVQDAYAQEFARLVEERSGGDVTVTVYPYGSLGTSAELTEQAMDGIVQLTHASPGHLGTLVPEVQVFSIPYLLSQNNAVNQELLTESPLIYGTIADALREQGLELLTMYPEGDMVWTTNREIRSPEDFENFRMRTMVSPMLVAAYESFGANPTPLPYSEVYGALQLNMIDGQVNPIFAIQEMGFYEVTEYMIWAGQQQFVTTVVANGDWYAGLEGERQELLDGVIADMADYIFETQEEYNQERLEMIREAKPEMEMIELTAEERAAFEERAEIVREQFVDMVGESGQAIVEGLEAEIQALEDEHGAEESME